VSPYTKHAHRNQSCSEFDGESKSGDSHRGGGHRSRNQSGSEFHEHSKSGDSHRGVGGEGGVHRSRNQSGSEFHERSKSGDFPRGRGVRDPETKSVGNFLKRVDPQTKLVYGHGKCLKTRKATRPQICLRTEKDLENLQVNLATTSSGALKLAENANIENASTPTRPPI